MVKWAEKVLQLEHSTLEEWMYLATTGQTKHKAANAQVTQVEGTVPSDTPPSQPRLCFYCQKPGHIARECCKKQADLRSRQGRGKPFRQRTIRRNDATEEAAAQAEEAQEPDRRISQVEIGEDFNKGF